MSRVPSERAEYTDKHEHEFAPQQRIFKWFCFFSTATETPHLFKCTARTYVSFVQSVSPFTYSYCNSMQRSGPTTVLRQDTQVGRHPALSKLTAQFLRAAHPQSLRKSCPGSTSLFQHSLVLRTSQSKVRVFTQNALTSRYPMICRWGASRTAWDHSLWLWHIHTVSIKQGCCPDPTRSGVYWCISEWEK